MAIYYLLLCISAVIFSSQFLITKQYQKRNGTGFAGTVRLMLFAYLTIAVFFCVKGSIGSGKFLFGFAPFTLFITLGSAVVSLVCVSLGIRVLSVGNMGIYSAFMMMGSLVLPSVVGVAAYGESVTFVKVFALVLMICAVVLSVCGEKGTKYNKKALVYYFVIFFLNGLIGVLFTVHQNRPELTAYPVVNAEGELTVNSDLFMTWYGLSTVFVCLSALFYVMFLSKRTNNAAGKEEKNPQSGRETAISLGLSVLYGVCNGIGNYFIALGTQPGALGASVTFPIVNGGTILFSTLLGFAVYREKIRWNMILCLILVVVSTVMFMYA